MSEYAVVWRDTDHPHSIYAGGLTVAGDGVRLRGSAGHEPVIQRFAAAEIEAVNRTPRGERIADFPSLRLDLRSGRSLLLASVTGVGVVLEVIETLTTMLGG